MDRQTDILKDGLINTCRQTYSHTDRRTAIQRQTNSNKDRQTDRQYDLQKYQEIGTDPLERIKTQKETGVRDKKIKIEREICRPKLAIYDTQILKAIFRAISNFEERHIQPIIFENRWKGGIERSRKVKPELIFNDRVKLSLKYRERDKWLQCHDSLRR